MLKSLALALLLGATASAALTVSAPLPPLCRVQITTSPHLLGRKLSIFPRTGCPPGGAAYLRLASDLGGSQPDNPPGAYRIGPGQDFQVAVLSWWHAEWRDRSGRWWRVPEDAE